MKCISKNLCGMAALLATCCGVNSHAVEKVEAHPAPTSVPAFQLAGDSYPTSVSTLWEWDLVNADGNQNQMSMAKCGDKIYLCVSHYSNVEGESRVYNLFLRTYSAETGESLGNVLIDVPADFKAGKYEMGHTITSDNDGNLIVAALIKQQSGKTLKIALRKVDFSGAEPQIDSATGIDIPLPSYLTYKDNSDQEWMERINGFHGSFDEGVFTFETTVGRMVNSQFQYTHVDVDVDYGREAADRIRTDCFNFRFGGAHFQNTCPDVVAYPGVANHYIVTLNSWKSGSNDTAGLSDPTLFSQEETTGQSMSQHQWHGTGNDYCRGFYPFRHNNHLVAAYGATHNETSGSRFRIVALPDEATFEGTNELAVIPSQPFPVGGSDRPIHPRGYRQLALADPTETQVRNNATSEVTRFYVCAPGSGIGAYELVTQLSPTGIDTPAHSDGASLRVEGHTLFAADMTLEGLTVEVLDFAGRTVHSARLKSSGHDLSMLQPGMYIVRVGSEVLKVSLR